MSEPTGFRLQVLNVASRIWNRPPTREYVSRVESLLFMTVAHESGGFQWRRQQRWQGGKAVGPLRDYVGAYGLIQMERDTVAWMLDWLQDRPDVQTRCQRYLADFGDPEGMAQLAYGSPEDVCKRLETPDGDTIGLALCRLRYLVVPEAIPAGLDAQGAYAKRYYNTDAGRATPQDYVEAYRRMW